MIVGLVGIFMIRIRLKKGIGRRAIQAMVVILVVPTTLILASGFVRLLPILALFAGFAFSALAEPPVRLDCTIRSWNDAFRKERAHDYDSGYSITKVAPSDIAWLRPGINPVGQPGRVGPTRGFVVLGSCTKGNVTSSVELRNLMINLSKVASDHGANAISYEKFGTEIHFQFLRVQDAILNAVRPPKQTGLR
jgi:hypothetical protein